MRRKRKEKAELLTANCEWAVAFPRICKDLKESLPSGKLNPIGAIKLPSLRFCFSYPLCDFPTEFALALLF